MVGYWERDAPVTAAAVAGGPCGAGLVKATTYVDFGKSAIVLVASWCAHAASVALTWDWDALGFGGGGGAKAASVQQPAIAGVQAAQDRGDGTQPFEVSPTANGGAILVARPA